MGWGVASRSLLVLVGVLSSGPGGCLYHRHKSLQMPSPGAEDGLSLGVIHIWYLHPFQGACVSGEVEG